MGGRRVLGGEADPRAHTPTPTRNSSAPALPAPGTGCVPQATAGRGASAGGCGSRPSFGNQGLARSVLLPPGGQGLSPACFGVYGTHPVPLRDKHCQAVTKVGTALKICKTPEKDPNVCSLQSSPATKSLGGGRPPELSRRHPGEPQKAKSPPEGPQWRRRTTGGILGLSPPKSPPLVAGLGEKPRLWGHHR